MLNFAKKHSNALVDTNELAAEMSERYNFAIKKIELLESELNQKTLELSHSYKAQSIMSDGVRNCIASLFTVQNQLQALAAHLDRSNKHISKLIQKNKALKSSSDAWLRRAIKLEFDVLIAKDKLKKIENERDSALKICELLQVELMLADKGNSQDRK